MSESGAIPVRPMTTAELETVLDWAAGEGWNPGLDDARHFHAADPDGFLVALDGAEPVAAVSVVRLGPRHGFLGLFLCRADRRGQGFGTALWRAGLARVAAGRAIGLDGVTAQQARYAREGFAYHHRTLRFVGAARGAGAPRLHPIAPDELNDAIELDQRANGLERARFLAGWLTPDSNRHVLVRCRGGALKAVGAMRRCRVGWKIGPLLAEHPDDAAMLAGDLIARAEGEQVTLDVPEPNGAAIAIAEALGLERVFETARMWRGDGPRADMTANFGICSLELG